MLTFAPAYAAFAKRARQASVGKQADFSIFSTDLDDHSGARDSEGTGQC